MRNSRPGEMLPRLLRLRGRISQDDELASYKCLPERLALRLPPKLPGFLLYKRRRVRVLYYV
jgi:hypothetical protein